MFRAALGFLLACIWYSVVDLLRRLDPEDYALCAMVGLIVAILLW